MTRILKTTKGQDILAFLFLLTVGVIYFFPALMGMDVRMGDVSHGAGMSAFLRYFHMVEESVAYWSPATFGGMPSTILYLPGDHLFLSQIIGGTIKFFGLGLGGWLLMALGFYTLLKSFRFSALLSAGGALLYAFSGYFIVVLSAGHFNKVYAIGACPILFAGFVHLVKQNKRLGYLTVSFGALITLISNHPQIIYYFGWIIAAYLIYELILAYRNNNLQAVLRPLLISSPLLIIAGLSALNIYFGTYEYSKTSIRGNNDISLSEEAPKDGLDLDYITQWSYGIEESWNFIIPNFKGGSSGKLGKLPAIQKAPQQFRQYLEGSSKYWGDQPFTAGPSYMGIVAFILFVLGLIFLKSKLKWVFLGVSLLALFLSWGKNLMGLTAFFVEYIPMYGKFRAVTMIHTIIELIIPLLAIWFLNDLVKNKISLSTKQLLQVGGGFVALLLVFYVGGGSLFSFLSDMESSFFAEQEKGNPQYAVLGESLKDIRIGIFKSDVLRTLLFVLLTFAILWAYLKGKVKAHYFLIGILSLGVVDLWNVDKRVLNTEKVGAQYYNFSEKLEKIRITFPPNQGDVAILQQETAANPELAKTIQQVALSREEKKSGVNKNQYLLWKRLNELGMHTNYRVLTKTANPFSDARTSYYHKSIGGYHAAKLRKIQNLADVHFQGGSFTPEVLKTLNIKYYHLGNQVQTNTNNYGPAWMVGSLIGKNDQTAIIKELGNHRLDKVALIATSANEEKINTFYDTTRTIKMTSFSPDAISYAVSDGAEGYAVLSEMYYEKGWTASFNGQPIDIDNVNYWMRGVAIPAGQGTLTVNYERSDLQGVHTATFFGQILQVLILIALILGANGVSIPGIKLD